MSPSTTHSTVGLALVRPDAGAVAASLAASTASSQHDGDPRARLTRRGSRRAGSSTTFTSEASSRIETVSIARGHLVPAVGDLAISSASSCSSVGEIVARRLGLLGGGRARVRPSRCGAAAERASEPPEAARRAAAAQQRAEQLARAGDHARAAAAPRPPRRPPPIRCSAAAARPRAARASRRAGTESFATSASRPRSARRRSARRTPSCVSPGRDQSFSVALRWSSSACGSRESVLEPRRRLPVEERPLADAGRPAGRSRARRRVGGGGPGRRSRPRRRPRGRARRRAGGSPPTPPARRGPPSTRRSAGCSGSARAARSRAARARRRPSPPTAPPGRRDETATPFATVGATGVSSAVAATGAIGAAGSGSSRRPAAARSGVGCRAGADLLLRERSAQVGHRPARGEQRGVRGLGRDEQELALAQRADRPVERGHVGGRPAAERSPSSTRALSFSVCSRPTSHVPAFAIAL